jgi:hypothetical protein
LFSEREREREIRETKKLKAEKGREAVVPCREQR